MQVLFSILTLLVGLSVPLLPMSSAFIPKLGLRPMVLGFRQTTRLGQIILLWTFAILSMVFTPSDWGWIAAVVAIIFSFLALNLYPNKIFISLDQPEREEDGLVDSAPVLAVEGEKEAVAYPLEILIPHHIINDILDDIPVLASW